jgi:hypothetical protein
MIREHEKVAQGERVVATHQSSTTVKKGFFSAAMGKDVSAASAPRLSWISNYCIVVILYN